MSTILALDIGNSYTKYAYCDAAGWYEATAVATKEFLLNPERYCADPFDRALVSNVVGDAAVVALRPWQGKLFWLTACAERYGVTNRYLRPEQLGSDRWAALIATRAKTSMACLVVSVGTALTADMLDDQGQFLGGIIAPGPQLMRQALLAGTALSASPGHYTAMPRTTDDAIETGIVQSALGAITRMANLLQAQTGTPPLLLLTGGAAARIAPHLNSAFRLVDNLVLEGLRTVAQKENWL